MRASSPPPSLLLPPIARGRLPRNRAGGSPLQAPLQALMGEASSLPLCRRAASATRPVRSSQARTTMAWCRPVWSMTRRNGSISANRWRLPRPRRSAGPWCARAISTRSLPPRPIAGWPQGPTPAAGSLLFQACHGEVDEATNHKLARLAMAFALAPAAGNRKIAAGSTGEGSHRGTFASAVEDPARRAGSAAPSATDRTCRSPAAEKKPPCSLHDGPSCPILDRRTLSFGSCLLRGPVLDFDVTEPTRCMLRAVY